MGARGSDYDFGYRAVLCSTPFDGVDELYHGVVCMLIFMMSMMCESLIAAPIADDTAHVRTVAAVLPRSVCKIDMSFLC